MGACLILAPAIVAGWPAITAAVAGAATALGFNLAHEVSKAAAENRAQAVASERKVELDVANSDVLESSMRVGERLVLTQGPTKVVFSRDVNGALSVCVTGAADARTLEQIGHQVTDKVTQMFIYNRVMTELKQKGFQIVDQQLAEDQTVHLHVRNTIS